MYKHNYGNSLEKLIPCILLFKVTQGHWNRHRSISYLPLSVNGSNPKSSPSTLLFSA